MIRKDVSIVFQRGGKSVFGAALLYGKEIPPVPVICVDTPPWLWVSSQRAAGRERAIIKKRSEPRQARERKGSSFAAEPRPRLALPPFPSSAGLLFLLPATRSKMVSLRQPSLFRLYLFSIHPHFWDFFLVGLNRRVRQSLPCFCCLICELTGLIRCANCWNLMEFWEKKMLTVCDVCV
jgi:hypothetical protein